MSEYYFKEFQDYTKGLCEKHKQVLHVDGTRRAFIRFESDEELQSIPNKAAPVMVIVANFSGRAIGNRDERKLRQSVTLLFTVNVSNTNGNRYAAIETAMVKAEGIMFDFLSKMEHDYELDDCGPLRYLEPELMTYNPIDGPLFENAYGWETTLYFKANAPAYNPDNWNA